MQGAATDGHRCWNRLWPVLQSDHAGRAVAGTGCLRRWNHRWPVLQAEYAGGRRCWRRGHRMLQPGGGGAAPMLETIVDNARTGRRKSCIPSTGWNRADYNVGTVAARCWNRLMAMLERWLAVAGTGHGNVGMVVGHCWDDGGFLLERAVAMLQPQCRSAGNGERSCYELDGGVAPPPELRPSPMGAAPRAHCFMQGGDQRREGHELGRLGAATASTQSWDRGTPRCKDGRGR